MTAEPAPRIGDGFSKQRDDISLRCQTNPQDIRRALLLWRHKLEACEHCADLLGRSEIVLAEILNNIAEHGQDDVQKDETGDWIELRCRISRHGIHMTVKDSGRALPQRLLTGAQHVVPSHSGVALDDLPEGGFGWFMIRELSRHLTCDRTEDGNLLSLTVPRLWHT